MLHVQEVGGQGTLGCVRVRRSALALLPVASLGLGARAAGACTQHSILQERGSDVADMAQVRETRVQHSVGMGDIGASQIGDRRLQIRQADKNLGNISGSSYNEATATWYVRRLRYALAQADEDRGACGGPERPHQLWANMNE